MQRLCFSFLNLRAKNFLFNRCCKSLNKQEIIPLGCVPPSWKPYMVQWQPPEVLKWTSFNKFLVMITRCHQQRGPRFDVQGGGGHGVEVRDVQGIWSHGEPPTRMTDRHLWKHYLPETLLAGGNKWRNFVLNKKGWRQNCRMAGFYL